MDEHPPVKLNWVPLCGKYYPHEKVKGTKLPVECGIEISTGIIDAKVGDWIVEENSGVRFVMNQDEFDALYFPLIRL